MRITAYTDYSLRVLIYLAVREGEMATIAQIAAAYGISHNHLMKVTHQLQLEGFVTTVRGKAGGMSLARPPAQISVGEVVRKMEPDLTLVECFGPDNRCAITPSCKLKRVLGKALKAFMTTLDEVSIADLVDGEKAGLMRDLGLSATGNSDGLRLRSAHPTKPAGAPLRRDPAGARKKNRA